MKRNRALYIAAAAMLFATGCTNISNRSIPREELLAPYTSPAVTSTAPVTEFVDNFTTKVTSATTVPLTIAEPETSAATVSISETYSTYTFSEKDEELLGKFVFVGDSICLGLSRYGVMEVSRVLAQGSVAARNISDFTFTYPDGKSDILTALVNEKPEYIALWMGMNDVNITSSEDFTVNLGRLISMIRSYLPDAKIAVLSITPISSESAFTDNKNIDSFNAAMNDYVASLGESAVTYVDVQPELSDSEGALKSGYCGSEDGVHLSEAAYYAVLSQICSAIAH